MMDIVERLGELRLGDKEYDVVVDAIDEIELLRKERDGLRKVNVMQAGWLHEAQQEHKKFKDYVRQLLSVESAALKDGE
jgi:hypothetical protein